MAVGLLRENFVRRWAERVIERPSDVKEEMPLGKGALEGSAVLSSSPGANLRVCTEGLWVKRDDMTSFGALLLAGVDLTWLESF